MRSLPIVTLTGALGVLVTGAPVAAAFPARAGLTAQGSGHTVPTARDCAVFPRRHLRIRLTTAVEEFAVIMPAVAAHIAGLWAAEGVQIQWIAGEAGESQTDVDVWIALVRELDTLPRGQVLGVVQFDQGVPLRLVRVSLNAVIRWLQRPRARQLNVPDRVLPLLADAAPKLAGALAHVGAHELGHYLLASRRHAADGLMRAVYDHHDLVGTAHAWRLDATSRNLLHQRIRQGETCGARRAAEP